MKKILQTAILSTSVFAFTIPAMAQTTPVVPGSETSIEEQNDQARENVADDAGAAMADPAATGPEGVVMDGNESQIDNAESAERDDVAAGTAAETTTDAGATSTTSATPIVPGSDATFNANAPATGDAEVLQDEATTDQVQ